MNLVISYHDFNTHSFRYVRQFILENNLTIDELTVSDTIKKNVSNIILPSKINCELLKNINECDSIKIIENDFYKSFLSSNSYPLRNKLLLFDSISVNFDKNITQFIKLELSDFNFNFYIRDNNYYINRFCIFLEILKIYFDFNYSINSNINKLNNINFQILTPAQKDIYGISITQIIMALQRNRIPVSDHYERSLYNLYIHFDYSILSILGIINLYLHNNNILTNLKTNFKSHDFSSLFK